MSGLQLVCTGRALKDGVPYGDRCGRTFTRRTNGHGGWQFAPGNEYAVWTPPVRTPESDALYRTAARSAGWAIGPDDVAICPRCRRPDPELVRICEEIERGLF